MGSTDEHSCIVAVEGAITRHDWSPFYAPRSSCRGQAPALAVAILLSPQEGTTAISTSKPGSHAEIQPTPANAPAARAALLVAAIALGLIALALPTEWYDALPRSPGLPPRMFEGTTLLRAIFLVEALVCAALAASGWRLPVVRDPAATLPSPPQQADLFRRNALVILALITLLGALLRIFRLGADLWLDEIATAGTYAARPLAEVFGAYLSPGNHLLNSLLLKVSVALFGESEWSVRLPAVAFGMATVPAIYWTARLAMSRAASLGAALLLAVSYHHIFFSQNARGYSAYLLFALLSSALLASCLRRDRPAKWLAYVVTTVLGFAALMTTAFAFGGQIVVGAVALLHRRRHGIPLRPLALRLAAAFGATGILALQIYAVSIPDVIAIYPTVYDAMGSGYRVFSGEFFAELRRGLSAAGVDDGAALPAIAIAATGFVILLRRTWELATGLALTLAITVAFLLIRGQSIAPRLLLIAVPLAILSAMATVDAAGHYLARRHVMRNSRATLAVLVAGGSLAAVSLLALPSYYAAPKQPYRSAIRRIEAARTPGAHVIVVFPAGGGFRYYLPREHVVDTSRYHFVETPAAYDSAMRAAGSGETLLVTTLFRVLRSTSPVLADRIAGEWVAATVLRGTVGDGGISIWRQRTRSRQ